MQEAPDFFIDPIGFFQFYWYSILLLMIQVILLLLLYVIITRVARRSLIRIGMGVEAATGIVLIIRLIFFILALMIVVGFFGANLGTLLSLSAIFGTALGLAFSQALGNIVSGLYVLTARPFRVGDYVRIGSAEGVVREITLNYTRIMLPDETKLLIPNSKVISSEVTNFRIRVSDYIQEQESIEKDLSETNHTFRSAFTSALRELKRAAVFDVAYRYTFDLSIHMSFDHKKIKENFDQVCERWIDVFVTKPIYFVWAKPTAAITYRFAIIVIDPMIIIKRCSDFMNELLEVYYNPK